MYVSIETESLKIKRSIVIFENIFKNAVYDSFFYEITHQRDTVEFILINLA